MIFSYEDEDGVAEVEENDEDDEQEVAWDDRRGPKQEQDEDTTIVYDDELGPASFPGTARSDLHDVALDIFEEEWLVSDEREAIEREELGPASLPGTARPYAQHPLLLHHPQQPDQASSGSMQGVRSRFGISLMLPRLGLAPLILSDHDLEELRKMGWARRKGVPGLWLLRDPQGSPIPLTADQKALWMSGGRHMSQEELDSKKIILSNELVLSLMRGDVAKDDLMGAMLYRAHLQGASLEKANLFRAHLQLANLRSASLVEADLREADIMRAEGDGTTNLAGANLFRACLAAAELGETSLALANLTEANLHKANLQSTDFTDAILLDTNFESANLERAALTGALQTTTKYKPPRPPAPSALQAWRNPAVARAAGSTAYQQGSQSSDGNGEDEGTSSEEHSAEEWERQIAQVVRGAVTGNLRVAELALALVVQTVAALEELFDLLSWDVQKLADRHRPCALVADFLINPIFDVALLQMMKVLEGSVKDLRAYCLDKGEWPAPSIALEPLQRKLQKKSKQVVRDVRKRMKDSRALSDEVPPPLHPEAREEQEQVSSSSEGMCNEREQDEELDEAVRNFATTLLDALVEDFIRQFLDPRYVKAYFKQPVVDHLNAMLEEAAIPAERSKFLHAAQAQHVMLKECLATAKTTFINDVLHKQISNYLIGILPAGIGRNAAQKFVVATSIEAAIEERFRESVLLTRFLPPGCIRARATHTVLNTATPYHVSVGGIEGIMDMLLMALSTSSVKLNSDEKELQYLYDELQMLKHKEVAAINWRHTVEAYLSVLQLRGELHVQCGQAVLDCICGDAKVLQALGAAKTFLHIDGDKPPSGLVAFIAEGPGAHMRKHAYCYLRRLARELVVIRRVKDLQFVILTFLGAALVGTSVALGNYYSRAFHEAVTHGIESQSVVIWTMPVVVVVGLLVLGVLFIVVLLRFWTCKVRMRHRGAKRKQM